MFIKWSAPVIPEVVDATIQQESSTSISSVHTQVSNLILNQSHFHLYTLVMHKTLFNKTLVLCFATLSSVVLSSIALANETCPKQFFEIAIPPSSMQCRVFGVKKPSAMSFYLNTPPGTAFLTFAKQLPNARLEQSKKMSSLVSDQPDIRIYVYPDGAGTQINIRAE